MRQVCANMFLKTCLSAVARLRIAIVAKPTHRLDSGGVPNRLWGFAFASAALLVIGFRFLFAHRCPRVRRQVEIVGFGRSG